MVTFYDVVVALHVTLVVFAFGVLFAYRWLPTGTESAHRARERLLVIMVERGGVAALATGVFLALDDGVFDQVWVLVPLAMLVLVTGLAGSVMIPRERRLRRDDLAPDERTRSLVAVQTASMVCAGCVVVAVFFMVTKLGDTSTNASDSTSAHATGSRSVLPADLGGLRSGRSGLIMADR